MLTGVREMSGGKAKASFGPVGFSWFTWFSTVAGEKREQHSERAREERERESRDGSRSRAGVVIYQLPPCCVFLATGGAWNPLVG